MTAQFFNYYVSNLELLSVDLTRNQKLVEILNENIKTLSSEVQEKLKYLFAEMVRKPSWNEDSAEQNSQIKIIYLLTRQMQKSQAEKRSLTREACHILDKYLVSFEQKVQSLTTHHLNSEDRHGEELRNTLLSIKPLINQPVQGKAVIIDLIKKIESGSGPNSKQSDGMILDDVNKNIELFSSVQNFNSLKFAAMAKEAVHNVSDLIHRVDNLQVFTDKIVDICSEIKNR